MTALVTLPVAKQHLRVDFTDDDSDIQMKIEQASEIVLNYIKRRGDENGNGGGGGGLIGAIAPFADGAAQIVLPAYEKLAFTGVTGTAATVEGGDLRVGAGGSTIVQFQVDVLHNWGSYVVFGYGWNGAAPLEFGRVQVNSNTPVPVFFEDDLALAAGGLLSLYISSDFEWSQFSWAGGEVTFVQTQATAKATGDWDPTTVPPPVQAAVLLMLSKLYDERDAGKEDNPEIAMGYLTPAITSLLHRFRDPALA